jgi:hypothetical protein
MTLCLSGLMMKQKGTDEDCLPFAWWDFGLISWLRSLVVAGAYRRADYDINTIWWEAWHTTRRENQPLTSVKDWTYLATDCTLMFTEWEVFIANTKKKALRQQHDVPSLAAHPLAVRRYNDEVPVATLAGTITSSPYWNVFLHRIRTQQ